MKCLFTILITMMLTIVSVYPEGVTILDWRDRDVKVYSVTGQHMSSMHEKLPQGIYELRKGEIVSKIIVR